MAHTYTSCFIHAVFSTRRRQQLLSPTSREHLTTLMQTSAASHGFRVLAAGGSDDHMHVLMKVPTILPIVKAIHLLKHRSATFLGRPFAWQEGFIAITITPSAIDETVSYIERQESIHEGKTYEEETISFLKKHRVRYDLRYVFD